MELQKFNKSNEQSPCLGILYLANEAQNGDTEARWWLNLIFNTPDYPAVFQGTVLHHRSLSLDW